MIPVKAWSEQLLLKVSPAVFLSQYYVAQGEQLTTGETVANPAGAIDIAAASCEGSDIYNQLDIYACGTNAQVMRLVRARTQVDSVDITDGLRTITIMFVGEPQAGDGVIQFLTDNETFVS